MISFVGVKEFDELKPHTEEITLPDGRIELVTMTLIQWWMLEYISTDMERPLPQILADLQRFYEPEDYANNFQGCMVDYVIEYGKNLENIL